MERRECWKRTSCSIFCFVFQKTHEKKKKKKKTFFLLPSSPGAKSGFVSDDCNEYVAQNQQCSAKTQCFTCWPEKGCSAVKEYRRLLVAEHGRLDGASTNDLKAEIYARGPISCGIDATEELDAHEGLAVQQGKIFKQFNKQPEINHLVSIVGWGVEGPDGEKDKFGKPVEYWIVRNSWGRAWVSVFFFIICLFFFDVLQKERKIAF